ncbi:NAD-dependent epimerase/dehydratase family protein [bacterium]|nr:NAD-dependent epimerase/dehydratase family protein [bacterium]
MSHKRLLIIGGSGHVSGNLARVAVDQGFAVTIVTRGQKPVPEGVRALVADRHDTAALRDALGDEQWDLAVDCIGYEAADARQDVELLRGRSRQFVFISTDFVFDPPGRRFPQPFDNPYFLQDDSYGAKKRRCELELLADDTGWHWTVFRPCHIYGAPSQLGCLPDAARDPELLARMQAGQPVRLVGGGHFLQQPIHARDLARLVLSAAGNPLTYRRIYCSVGPDIITSYRYYEIIAEVLGVPVTFEELPVAQSLAEHPEWVSFLCHRIYDLTPLRLDGLQVPNTPITQGLREHTEWLLGQHTR